MRQSWPVQSRRAFVQMFAALAAVSSVGGTRFISTVLAQAHLQSDGEGGLLRLRVSDFPALQEVFGSVRIGTSPVRSNHTPAGLFYPVIITRGSQDQFYALDAACTHEGCTVPIYNPSAACMECPCHGSQYRIDGTVQRGPAGFPLRQFAIRYDGRDWLQIEMPDISFAFTARPLGAPVQRLKLEFIAFEEIEYQVYSRAELATEWTGPVSFAVSPEGPIDQTSVLGRAHIASVYLAPTGVQALYAVAMRTAQV